MDCPSCDHPNPEQAGFCGECGTPLVAPLVCSSCGVAAEPSQKFCHGCGNKLVANADGSPDRAPRDYTPRHLAEKILNSKSALEGERKRVSVLFADIKGSMELAERTDPEEWHAILDRFFQILSDGVHRFEGTVNQYTGDGIMALFGAPIAHEDHAQRACYAALHLRDELRTFSDELRLSQGIDFAVRIGINSGDVVVGKIGDDLRMDYTAQGHTVGLAQRMEQLAAAHAICVSEATAEIASGYVELRDLGAATIKGASEPILVYELIGMGEMLTRFDVSRSRGLTRFVGRDDDMQVLDRALEQARSGVGQVVGVVADAGTGKSRLCFEFAERCRGLGLRVNHGSGVAHGKNIPLLPIMQVFRAYFGIGDQDDDRTAREKIAGRLLLLDENYRDALPLVFEFMAVPDPDRLAPTMEPEAKQIQLFAIMRKLIQSTADRDASITLIEDLHWVDSATEAWIEQMVDAVSGTKALLIVNFRPEYHATWMQKSWYRQLPLLPLGTEAIRELLADLLGEDESTRGLAEAIHARTAGNPFFTEEVVRALIESGHLAGERGAFRLVTQIGHLEVPNTVQSVLAARIDRLIERDKQMLQTAAVIGKEFPESVLSAVSNLPAVDLSSALQALKDNEFIFQQSLYPISEYAFKHPLTQEVALESQLKERRSEIHGAVARAIEESQSDRLQEFAALLAHHYEQAGEASRAVRWHLAAADWLLTSSVPDAIAHWDRVYDLTEDDARGEGAKEQRLIACDKLLSNAWRTGLTEERWEELAREGTRLAEELNDREALFNITIGLAAIRFLCGMIKDAVAPCDQAQILAEELGDAESRIAAIQIRVNVLWHGGTLSGVDDVVEAGLELADGDLSFGKPRYGFSLPNWIVGMHAGVAMLRGQPKEAIARAEQCMRVAQDRGEVEVMSWCQGSLAELGVHTGADDLSLQRAQRALELAEQIGSPISIIMGHRLVGLAHLSRGEVGAAVEALERAERGCREGRIAMHLKAATLGNLADARLQSGEVEHAERLAREGVEFGRLAGTHLYKLHAVLALARSLRALDARGHEAEIEKLLSECDSTIADHGGRMFLPFVAEERARLAAALHDESGSLRWLREAKARCATVGATGHAARLDAELAALERPDA